MRCNHLAEAMMSTMDRLTRRRFLAAAAAVSLPLGAWAQATTDHFPSRPIKIIIPAAPGGGGDTAVRAVSQALMQREGWSVVIDNRPGGNGVIGTMAAATAAPDGYTYYLGIPDTMEINPHLTKTNYDPVRSFDPVAPIGRYPLILCVRSDFPGNTLADVITAAKASPGTVKFASWGPGSIAHLAGVVLEQSAGVRMLHVPYRSGSAAHLALMAKEVDLLVMAQSQAIAQQSSGKSKMVATLTARRTKSLPDLPSMAELGHPAFAWDYWLALFAPAGTPSAMRETVANAVNAYLSSPQGLATFTGFGYETIGGTTAELAEALQEGNRRWERIVRERGIRVD